MKLATTAITLAVGSLPTVPQPGRAQGQCCEIFRTQRGGRKPRKAVPCLTPKAAMAVGQAMALNLGEGQQ